MTNIVALLRSYADNCKVDNMPRAEYHMRQAADEIEKLRSQLVNEEDRLDTFLGKIAGKLAQLHVYRDNDCKLDHARTIADGRILQAEQILKWVHEAICEREKVNLDEIQKSIDADMTSEQIEAYRKLGIGVYDLTDETKP